MQPVDGSTSQGFGDNPTADLPADSWLIQTFGNYQPNGHTGVDYPVHEGTPVRAVAAGTVKHCGWYSGSYADNPYWIAPAFAGFVLVIDHGSFVGIYAHLSGSPVATGEEVRAGQTVAYSGNTGGSTGPHLHFEVLPNGWDFNNGMYGRVSPSSVLTPGIAAQGDITTSEEDDMALSDDDVLRIARASAKETLNWAVTQEVDGRTVHTAALSWFLLSAADAADKNRELTVAAVVEAYGNKRLPKIGADGKPNPNDYTTPNLEDSWAAYNAAQSRALIEQLAVKQGVTIDYDLIAQKVADELGNRLGGN